MDLFMMILTTVVVPIWYIYPSRIISMTFKTSGKSITIKNEKLAELLIAEKNTWGIETNPGKRNKMSLLGVISYIIVLPQIAFLLYNWWIYMKTRSGQWCEAEQSYLWTAMLYYLIAFSIKLNEAIKFQKRDIW